MGPVLIKQQMARGPEARRPKARQNGARAGCPKAETRREPARGPGARGHRRPRADSNQQWKMEKGDERQEQGRKRTEKPTGKEGAPSTNQRSRRSRDREWIGPGGGNAQVIGCEPPAQLLGTQQDRPGNRSTNPQRECHASLNGGKRKKEEERKNSNLKVDASKAREQRERRVQLTKSGKSHCDPE